MVTDDRFFKFMFLAELNCSTICGLCTEISRSCTVLNKSIRIHCDVQAVIAESEFSIFYVFLAELIFSVPCGIHKSLNFTYRAAQKKSHTFRLWTVIPENGYLSVRCVFQTVYLLLLLYLILL